MSESRNCNSHSAHPVGTRIRFKRTITESACGDHPEFLLCIAGEYGVIVGYGTVFPYKVKTNYHRSEFYVKQDEIQVIE